MRTERLLRKLEPLIPTQVKRWQRALDLADPDFRRLIEQQIYAEADAPTLDGNSVLELECLFEKKGNDN